MGKVISIRGATTLQYNSKKEITEKTLQLIMTILEANGLHDNKANIVNCLISSTADIDECYPATAITESGILVNVPLFSTLEPRIKNSIPLCIRILLTVYCMDEVDPKHIYLGGAANLKTNITKN